MADLTGQQLGNYQIGELIGRGGMATVYRAHQQSMGRDVAIKVMASELTGNTEFVARFEREAQVIARLEHPHILPVIDTGRDGDYLYLVMRLVTGGVLSERLHGSPLTIQQTERLLGQIAAALEYAHRAGIIHRDLKPTNVLLDAQDNVYLTDFGIAKMLAGSTSNYSLTATGRVMGTPAYMAPEQWRSEPVDARTDIYALGVILYELLLGALPFNSETPYGMMYKHFDQMPAPPRAVNPNIPQALERVVLRALAKRAEERYPSAQQMAHEYTAAIRTLPAEVAASALPRVTVEQIERATPPGGAMAAGSVNTSAPTVDDTHGGATQPPATDYIPAVQPSAYVESVALPTVARDRKQQGRSGLVIGLVALLLIAAVVVGAVLVLGGGDDDPDEGLETVVGMAEETPSVTPTMGIVVILPTRTATQAGAAVAPDGTVTSTHTAEPSVTVVPTATDAPTDVPTDTPSPTVTDTPTQTVTPSATPDLEATTEALLNERLTQTATQWTDTPTPDIEATVVAALTGTASAWTDTPTPTFMPTLPPLPTVTQTRMPTVPPLLTVVPSPTLVPTLPTLPTTVPTLTPFPTTVSGCSMPQRLEVGKGARTTLLPDTPTSVRSYADLTAPRERSIPPGLMFEVQEGPECADGVWWWRVRGVDIDGNWVGWVGEGRNDTYWVEPYEVNSIVCPGSPPPRLTPGETARIALFPPTANRVRSAPEVTNNLVGQLQPGDEFDVISGPVCDPDNHHWRWWLVSNDQITGWSAEGVAGEYWMEPWP